MGDHAAVPHGDERLGRGAHDLVRLPVRGLEGEEVHVGARVHHAQDAVHVQTGGVRGDRETAGDDGLEHVAVADRPLGLRDSLAEAFGTPPVLGLGGDLVRVRLEPAARDVADRVRGRGGQALDHGVQTGERVVVGAVRAGGQAVAVHRVGDQRHGAVQGVVHGQVGDEVHREVGQAEVVLGRVRQALPRADRVPPQEAGHAGDEMRQDASDLGAHVRAQQAQARREHVQGAALRGQPLGRGALPVRLAVPRGQGDG